MVVAQHFAVFPRPETGTDKGFEDSRILG